MLKKLFFSLIGLGFLSVASVIGVIYYLVVVNPGPEIKIDNIRSILGKESHVLYNDGRTRLGAFFDQNHRQYVKYEKIPVDFVNALVAAEDNQFFSHFGFDPAGITRAAIKNIQAGRVVQGGSTLTQQTAKNLFKRTDRSLQAKLKELLFALRLEYWYSKEQIFEFYSNQFYVSGNGHGLGVAARYYFNKKPQELTLLECAFIAGSVKRPNAYNPFIKKTREKEREAIELGRRRANYVLRNMYELDMIGLGRYREVLSNEIVFNKGEVGYSRDYTMDLVTEAVSSKQVQEALEQHGITNVAVSGIRIITNIDKELQEYSLQKLRSELSRLDIRLRGYEREEVQKEYQKLKYKGDYTVAKGAFLFGTVDEIDRNVDDPEIKISFSRNEGTGVIDKSGLTTALTAYARYRKNRWSESDDTDTELLLEEIRSGDKVWVSVEAIEGSSVKLTLEKYPQVQGGSLVMHKGEIIAVVGGTENRFYNRAIDARRTMGSSFKPFLYAAAVQLGWNAADVLNNKRDIFVYQAQPYFPRPDHDPKSEKVSMSWAGVHSENVASIWLTAHLCDKLSLEQLHEVAFNLDLAPKVVDGDKEPYSSYRSRIRDQYGIQVNRDALRKAAFEKAVISVETDFIFEGLKPEYELLSSLHYGQGFDRFYADIEAELIEKAQTLRSYEREELELRKEIVSTSYLSLQQRMTELDTFISQLNDPLAFFSTATPAEESEPSLLYFDRLKEHYVFTKERTRTPSMLPVNLKRLQDYLLDKQVGEQKEFWQQVVLDGDVSVAAFELLQDQVAREYSRLEAQLPYSFETLAEIEDFRILVGLHYLIGLAREFGVKSPMEPVLSFPLGSNVVTLYETTRIYEGLATGKVNFYGDSADEGSGAALAVIDRIESAEGRVLYKSEKEERRILDKRTQIEISHILENTVKFGTGRYADRSVKIQPSGGIDAKNFEGLEVTVPLLGKTGTANRYTNAAFYGFMPGLAPNGEGVDLEDGYTIGVYVGYDNNDPMRRTSSRISGAAGALPTWTGIVQQLVKKNHYASKLDPVEISFSGLPVLREADGQNNLMVSEEHGGMLIYPVQTISESARYTPSIITFGEVRNGGAEFVAERHFEPYWRQRPMRAQAIKNALARQ